MNFKNQVTNFYKIFIPLLILLWILPFPLDQFNFLYKYVSHITKVVNSISAWIGELFFSVELNEMQMRSGSSDSFLGYLRLFTSLIFAFLISLAVVFLKISDTKVKQFYLFSYVYIRYFLGLTLIGYGVVKLTGLQFGNSLSYLQLEQSFGEATPMGILWKFMTSSREYTIFTGVIEIISGSLLLFRKTLVLGLILSFMSLLQVVVLNYAFDVSVKLFSSKLLIICLFLLFPFLKVLFDFFVEYKKVQLEVCVYRRNLTKTIIKYSIIVGVPLISYLETKKYIEKGDRNHLGVYVIENLKINNDSIPITEGNFKIVLDKYSSKLILPNKKIDYFECSFDSIQKSLTFKSFSDSTFYYKFKYQSFDNNKFNFFGCDNKDVRYKMLVKKKTRKDYNLYKERFHWVTEFPRNR